MRGWTGGEDGTKVMIFEVDMPHCDTGDEECTWDRPAIWALNARVGQLGQTREPCFLGFFLVCALNG